MYRLSKCVHIVEKNNNRVAFNDYNFKIINLNDKTYKIIQNLENYDDEMIKNNDELTYLLQHKFIVKKKKNELLDRDKKIELIRKKIIEHGNSKIGYMRLSLTEECNLRCKYCFVNDIVTKSANISEDKFKKAVQSLIINNNHPRIQYFGGEPLMRMELIIIGHKMLSQAKKDGIIDDFTEEIVTNGTLLTEDKMNFFIENKISLIFSIDGWKEIHDKNRVNVEGKGSFDIVVNNLKIFMKKGGKAEIIITPNKDNIDLLDKVVEFIVQNYNVKDISINAPQPNESGWNIDGLKFAKQIINSYLYCEAHNIQLSAPGLNLIYNLLKNRYQIFSCINYGTLENKKWGLYLFSSGQVSYCNVECCEECCEPFDNFKITERINRWHLKNNYTEKCKKCLAYSVCGGPCSMEKEMIKNKKILNNKCIFNKEIVKWALTR